MSTPAEMLADWLNGTPTGGPESDGRYPLIYKDDVTYLVYCPAAQALNPLLSEQPIEVYSITASNAATTAAAEADEATQASIDAQTAAADAAASASSALTSKNSATASATAATTAKTAAEAARDLAEDWANTPENVVVTGGLYSAYHWAQKALASGGGAGLGVANLWTAIQTFERDTVVTRVGQAVNTLFKLDGDSGKAKQIQWFTAGSLRWSLHSSNIAESGSNVGSNLILNAFDDAGALAGQVWTIPRATQIVALTQTPTHPTPTTGDSTTKSATTAFVQAEKAALLAAANSWSGANTFYIPGGTSYLTVDVDAGAAGLYRWTRGGLNRWQLQMTGATESGSNAGAGMQLGAYSDAGSLIGYVYSIVRATQVVTFLQIPAHPTPTAGDNSTQSATTAFVQNAVSGGTGAWSIVKKTADTSRTSTASMTNDPDLVIALAASSCYRIRGQVFFTSANATPDFQYQCAYSGTFASTYHRRAHTVPGTATGTDNETTRTLDVTLPATGIVGTGTGIGWLEFDVVINTTTAGNFSFQWAQNTSDANATTVLKGSMLEYHKVS